MHGEIEAVRVVVGDALLDEIEGRQHREGVHQIDDGDRLVKDVLQTIL